MLGTRKMRLLLTLSLVLLAACSPRVRTYPPQSEITFMRACSAQPGALVQRCACMWDKIEAGVDPNDFAALERMPGPQRNAHPLMQQILGYKQECTAQFPGSPPVEPAPAP
jgi:hypothetical protein